VDKRLHSRRTFLTSWGDHGLAACERQGRSAIVPYTKRPQEVVPGVANFYASSFPEGRRAYSVLVKTREGRPIHITGNVRTSWSQGQDQPRALADVLRLYDPDRLRGPKIQGRPPPGPKAEQALIAALVAAKRENRPVLLLTGATSSPTRKALLADLKAALPTLEHLAWEPALGDGAQEGAPGRLRNARRHSPPARQGEGDPLPRRGFPEWRGSRSHRGLHRRAPSLPARHVYEPALGAGGAMSLTGTNADQRFPVRPSGSPPWPFRWHRSWDRYPPALAFPTFRRASPRRKAFRRSLEEIGARSQIRGPRGRGALRRCHAPETHVAAALLNAMLGSQALDVRPPRASPP